MRNQNETKKERENKMTNVKTYQILSKNGFPIRKATKVIFDDGCEICFIDLMSKKSALKQGTEMHLHETIHNG